MVSGFFSEEKVSEVRERASIMEVVSDYVTLKKTGRNYKGLCPFHSEKTPSFMVNEEKQIFHCFGCGEGGDVFKFLIKMGHFSFPQAVEELAKRYGVKLPPKELSPAQKKDLAKRDLLFQINQASSDYYHDLLTRQKEGDIARRYLTQRGIREETIQIYKLGYSLDRWDGLVRHLEGKKLSLEMARELGLVFPKKTGGWYDAFRGRIIFPILDLYQRVVGFGGRVIQEGNPKYLNSPESAIYHKGEILYGLPEAKRSLAAGDQVLIVEGYFDLLMLHQCGFKQSVATLGTALTPDHVRTLKRYTNNFVTVFDGDPAGVQAALRSLPLFLEGEVWGEAVLLPKGEDPDGFLRKKSPDAFQSLIEKRIPLIDFFLEERMKGRNSRSVEEKVKVAREGLGLIRKIPEGVRRSLYLKTLAEKLDLQETMLQTLSAPPSRQPQRETGVQKSQAAEETFPRSEVMVISLIIHHPQLIPTLSAERLWDHFESSTLRKIGEDLERLYQKRGALDLPSVVETLDEVLRAKVREIVFRGEAPEGDLEKMLRDCIQKIHERRFKRDQQDRLRKIREIEKRSEEGALKSLLIDHQRHARKEAGE